MTVSLTEVKASNAQIDTRALPRVAVFVGATSGIGQATLALLVEKQSPIRVYVVGRDQERHEPLLEQLRQSNAQAEIIWTEAQVSLLADVKRVCDEIKAREQSIDLLFLSAGNFPLGERKETAEGLDLHFALSYYTKAVFLTQLLPLLSASRHASPRAIAILGGGDETGAPLLDDFDLRQPGHRALATLLAHSATAVTLGMARLATRHPRVTLLHAHPGLVSTALLDKALVGGGSWWGAAAGLLLKGAQAVLPVFSSPQQAGQRSLYLVTSARFGGKGAAPLAGGRATGVNIAGGTGSGALFVVDGKLECLRLEKVLPEWEKNDASDRIWKHTEEVVRPHVPEFA